MNDMTPTSAERAAKLEGMGCKRKRVEDIRFVQGKGNYVDDIKLPGMLYGDLVRSTHGHARVKRIDTAKAAALPGVVAVTTAETLKTVNLAGCRRSLATPRWCSRMARCCSRTRRLLSLSRKAARRQPTPSNWSRWSTSRCRSMSTR